MNIAKNTFSRMGVSIAIWISTFCTGRYCRIKRITEDSIRTEQRIEQLTEQVGNLEAELQSRVKQCEQLEGQLISIGDGLDESIRAAGSIRDDIKRGTEELRGSNQIIIELRKRFTQYETRIGELTEDLRRIKEGSSKQ